MASQASWRWTSLMQTRSSLFTLSVPPLDPVPLPQLCYKLYARMTAAVVRQLHVDMHVKLPVGAHHHDHHNAEVEKATASEVQ